MKYQLEFENYQKERKIKGIFETEENACAAMAKELFKKGIKPYYYRSWEIDGVTHIDYGSHSEFYLITKIEDNNKRSEIE